MMRLLLKKFFKSPIDFTKIVFRKIFIDPIKYKIDDDYNAEKYWKDRLAKYGNNVKGPGDEGATEKMNIERYKRVTSIFRQVFIDHTKDYLNKDILEIGHNHRTN